jgi:hypothetical protein
MGSWLNSPRWNSLVGLKRKGTRDTHIADEHRALGALLEHGGTLRTVVAHRPRVLAEVRSAAFPLDRMPWVARKWERI